MLCAVFRVGMLLLAASLVRAETPGISGVVRVTTTLTKKRISVPQVYERAVAIAAPAAGISDVEAELRRRFEPEVVAIPAGSTVSFPNGDPIFHNVFSLSDSKRFDLGNYRAGDTRMVTFDKPGVAQVHCHLHANMSGAILITPNSWVTQPAASGAFSLPPLAPGKYTLVAWHKTAGFFRREIEVRDGEPVKVDFEIPILESAGHH